jgi:hypothetical protein
MSNKTCPFGEIKEDKFFSRTLGEYQKIKEVWGKSGPNNAINLKTKAKVCFADFEQVTPINALKLTDALTFGKHKGETIQEVLDDAPDYLAWAIDEIDWFELDSQADQALEQALGWNDDNNNGWHEAFDLLA